MKATFTDKVRHNGRNYGQDKETIDNFVAVVVKDGEAVPAVRAAFYMGRSREASRVYCTVWTNGGKYGLSVSGTGWAGGYGYCKRSAAMQSALDSAGIQLSEPIYGRGETAIREALTAIVRAMGYRGAVTIV